MSHKFRAVPIADIPEDPKLHSRPLRQLKEGYETLSRQRGGTEVWMVTIEDLIHFGLITQQQADAWAKHIGHYP